MSEYREQSTIRQAVPVRSRPVVETQTDTVVHEHREISGVAIVALVLAAIAAASVITMLIMQTQQRNSDDLERERARSEAAQQLPAQPPQQSSQPTSQPPVVVMPPQPSAPVVVPSPSQSGSTTATPSNVDIQIEITSKFLDDEELRSLPIEVKVSAGTVTLNGEVKSEELKARAETLAKTIKGVKSVTNNITVQP